MIRNWFTVVSSVVDVFTVPRRNVLIRVPALLPTWESIKVLLLLSMTVGVTVTPSRAYSQDSKISAIYDQLAESLRPRVEKTTATNSAPPPYWIAIAGGPGSGKSTSAREVATRLNSVVPGSTIVIPMDGWHIPKDELIKTYGIDGLKRRGAPWTFDVDKCYDMLSNAKQHAKKINQDQKDLEFWFPIYDRFISDPLPGGGVCYRPFHHKVVIVEGLYLLHTKDPKWAKLQDLWDDKWFIKCPTRESQINRLVRRSLRTWNEDKAKIWGPGKEGARARAEYNDVQNMDLVAYCEDLASTVITTD